MPQIPRCPPPAELLRQMVRVDTVNTRFSGRPFAERELALLLEQLAHDIGLQTRRLDIGAAGFNLLVFHEARPRSPWVLFESHLDTVGVDNMTIDPFGGETRNGRLYGRGACDTKGTGAAMLCALAAYAAITHSDAPNNAALLFTLDEECSKIGISAFVDQQLRPLGWRFAGAIVGEPTQLRPVVAHNGCFRLSIRTQGVAAHSADPGRGRSAISMMARVVHAIESRYIPGLAATHPLTGKAQCSINQIHGGVAINIIPDSCEIGIDRRVAPGEDPASVPAALERLLDELRAADPELNVRQLAPSIVDPPLDPRGAEGFIRHVGGVLRSLHLPDESCGAGYGTDASNLSDAGVPAIVLGPGDIAQAHTADEWIDLAELERGVEVYRRILATPVEASP